MRGSRASRRSCWAWSGPAIVPGDPEQSWLYNAITHEDFEMPPKRKLPQHVIDDFREWIEMGAPDPRDNPIAEVSAKITAADIDRAKDTFWAYRRPAKVAPGLVEDVAWPRTDI